MEIGKIKVIFITEDGRQFDGNFKTQKQAEAWRDNCIEEDRWQLSEGHTVEIKDITQELALAETERKNKKKLIKDALELITDTNTKKVLKYLLRNIDNEE